MLLQSAVCLPEQRYGLVVVFAEGMLTQSGTANRVRRRNTGEDIQIDGRVWHIVGNQDRGIVKLIGLLEPAGSESLRPLPRSSAHRVTRARSESTAVA